MQAIVVTHFGEPDVLVPQEIPVPQAGAGQVLVHVAASGINPVDTYIRAGKYPALPPLPYTPGVDGAGTVAAIGAGVTGLRTGDRVYLSGSLTGTYATHALCRAADVHPLPKRIGFTPGAGVGVPYGTAYRALVQRGAARAGELLLIHGASGSVGTAAVQFAQALGLRVFGTAGTPEGLRRVVAEGAEQAFDHTQPDYLDQIRAASGGKGADLILEMLANVNLAKDLDLVARRGRIVVIGTRGKIEIDPRRLLVQESEIRAVSLAQATPEEHQTIYAAVDAGLAEGTLRPAPGREFPLPQAPAAHRAVEQGKAKGKVILIP
jgi:NADPH2:quinone reductase